DVAAEPAPALNPFGLEAPDLLVTLADKGGKPLGALLAAKANGKYYAMREAGPTVFEVRDYMFTRLDKGRVDFVNVEPPPGASTTTATVPDAGADTDGGGDEPEE